MCSQGVLQLSWNLKDDAILHSLRDNSIKSRCHEDVYSLSAVQETPKDIFTKATCRPLKASSKDVKGHL